MAVKHSKRRSLPYASSMAYLGRTLADTSRSGEEGWGMGTGGGRIRGTRGTETDGTGNGQGMAVGEAGESGEGGGGEKRKTVGRVP